MLEEQVGGFVHQHEHHTRIVLDGHSPALQRYTLLRGLHQVDHEVGVHQQDGESIRAEGDGERVHASGPRHVAHVQNECAQLRRTAETLAGPHENLLGFRQSLRSVVGVRTVCVQCPGHINGLHVTSFRVPWARVQPRGFA